MLDKIEGIEINLMKTIVAQPGDKVSISRESERDGDSRI
jgi:hypothetical protein